MNGDQVFVTLVNPDKPNMKDIAIGDKMDGYRFSGLKINGGRRWKKWHVPAALLCLERRDFITPKRGTRSAVKK